MDPQETQSLQSQIDELKNAPDWDHNLDPQTLAVLNNKLDLTPGLAFGDILYVSGSGELKRLSPGTSGYFLQTLGVGFAPQWASAFKFGGDGSDGALAITSGTTTIDLANAAALTKNYTSISITGTGKLAFSNPHANGTFITIRSQGNVTLTSSATPMIDCSGLGAAGGTGGSGGTNGLSNGAAGTSGSNGQTIQDALNHYGTGGGGASGSSPGTAGTAGAITNVLTNSNVSYYTLTLFRLQERSVKLFVGSGGGGGGGGNSGGSTGPSGGPGGRGGGALMIECAGALNFTTTNGISVAGLVGSNGSNAVDASSGGGGGGGGGSCGSFLCLYNTLTANTGSVNTSGGAGGVGGNGGANDSNRPGGGAGAGASSLNAGGAGGAGNVGGSSGIAGSNGGAGAGGGGGGGSGSVITTGGTGGAAGTSSSDSNASFINKNLFF